MVQMAFWFCSLGRVQGRGTKPALWGVLGLNVWGLLHTQNAAGAAHVLNNVFSLEERTTGVGSIIT